MCWHGRDEPRSGPRRPFYLAVFARSPGRHVPFSLLADTSARWFEKQWRDDSNSHAGAHWLPELRGSATTPIVAGGSGFAALEINQGSPYAVLLPIGGLVVSGGPASSCTADGSGSQSNHAPSPTATSANRFRVVLVERFARERLRALARVEGALDQNRPAVLFLCVHNAGRSQMALGWFTQMARSRAIGWSAGSMPVDTIDQAAVAAMAEVGIDISLGFSKPWSEEVMLAVDVVVTMGCGDACPLFPGKRYEDWDIEDPSGQTVEQIRPIRDQIGRRVADLLDHLGIPVEGVVLGASQPLAASTVGSITAGRAPVAAVEWGAPGSSALSRRRRWRRGEKHANWS